MGKKRWWGQELEGLRLDYTGTDPLAVVAKKHRTGLGTIAKLARLHKWPPRRHTVPHLHTNPSIHKMKARVIYLDQQIKAYTREMSHLEHKIQFLESLGGR